MRLESSLARESEVLMSSSSPPATSISEKVSSTSTHRPSDATVQGHRLLLVRSFNKTTNCYLLNYTNINQLVISVPFRGLQAMYVCIHVCMEDPYDPQPRSLTGTYNMHVDMLYVVYIVVSTHRAVIISNNTIK